MSTSMPTAEAPAATRKPSIWPNVLCWFRLACGPIVAGLVLWGESVVFSEGRMMAGAIFSAAAALFVLAALTDLLDGWIARATGSVTAFGAALDHAADKSLTLATLVALAVVVMPIDMVIAVIVLVVRDVAIAGLREGLSASGRAPAVSFLGKVKTVLAMLAAIATLALQPLAYADVAPEVLEASAFFARALLWGAVAAALLSAVDYVTASLRRADAGAGQIAPTT